MFPAELKRVVLKSPPTISLPTASRGTPSPGRRML
jgi:hypothetical protein